MDMQLVILVVIAISVVIAFYAVREDKQDREIKRLIDNAIDRDNDGWVLERTPLVTQRAPKKKAAVKKKSTSKPKKKSAASKPKKKAVAKKKSR